MAYTYSAAGTVWMEREWMERMNGENEWREWMKREWIKREWMKRMNEESVSEWERKGKKEKEKNDIVAK